MAPPPIEPSAGWGSSPATGRGGDSGTERPERGELHIKERRSWRTWQLAMACAVTALIGMYLGHGSGSPSASGAGTSGSAYHVPPPSASASGTATTTTVAQSASSATTTSLPTTATTAPTAATGTATVLVPRYQAQGNWTSTAFTITGGTWNIGWAFQCSPVPASGPSFQVFVVKSGAAPAPPAAVSQTGASGQSINAQTSLGAQQLVVQAPAGCIWVVKVTGVGTAG
jgi:hypothetical protein